MSAFIVCHMILWHITSRKASELLSLFLPSLAARSIITGDFRTGNHVLVLATSLSHNIFHLTNSVSAIEKIISSTQTSPLATPPTQTNLLQTLIKPASPLPKCKSHSPAPTPTKLPKRKKNANSWRKNVNALKIPRCPGSFGLAACHSPGESPNSSTPGSQPIRKRRRNNGSTPNSDP